MNNLPIGSWYCTDNPIHEKRQYMHEIRYQKQVEKCKICGEELNENESIICDWCEEVENE